jgi:Na+/phosphate symporter
LNFIIQPLFEHINNQHKPFIKIQDDEIVILIGSIDEFCVYAQNIIKEKKFDELDNLIRKRDEIIAYLLKTEKAQIRRIKDKQTNTRNSVLYFNTLSEIKNMLLHTINLIKSHRDFVIYSEKKN